MSRQTLWLGKPITPGQRQLLELAHLLPPRPRPKFWGRATSALIMLGFSALFLWIERGDPIFQIYWALAMGATTGWFRAGDRP